MILNLYAQHKAFGPLSKAFSARAFFPVEDIDGLFLNRKLAKYTLLKKLGEGAFGSVFLAEMALPNGDRKLVAIKVTQRHWVNGTERLHQELKYLNFFTKIAPGCRSTTQLIESFIDEYNYYIVQEYVPGGTLRDELWRSGRLDLARAIYILLQLITIVKHLHHHGVMHRDIKPDNVLIDATGHVVLADFGLAYQFRKTPTSDILKTSELCGTIGYMAPEVLSGEDYSSSADIYSLGILFYEMLTGRLPFVQHDLDVGLAMRNKDFSVPIDSLPSDVTSLLSLMLEWKEDDRITMDKFETQELFKGIDWDAIARRTYNLSDSWAPPIPMIDRNRTIDKNVLLHGNRRRAHWFRIGLTPFDRTFNTPLQPLRVNRPSPPPPQVLRVARPQQPNLTRASVRDRLFESIPLVSMQVSLDVVSQERLGPIRIPARAEREAGKQSLGLKNAAPNAFIGQEYPSGSEAEGDIADEILSTPSPAPSTSAIAIANAHISPKRDASTKYSLFTASVGAVHGHLLSPSAGMGCGRALAFRVQLPSPRLQITALTPNKVTPGLLTPPSMPVLDSSGTSLASSSGLLTPASENPFSEVVKDELVG